MKYHTILWQKKGQSIMCLSWNDGNNFWQTFEWHFNTLGWVDEWKWNEMLIDGQKWKIEMLLFHWLTQQQSNNLVQWILGCVAYQLMLFMIIEIRPTIILPIKG